MNHLTFFLGIFLSLQGVLQVVTQVSSGEETRTLAFSRHFQSLLKCK